MGLLTENIADIFQKGIATNQLKQPFNQKAKRHLFCAKKFQLFAVVYEPKPFNNLFLLGNFYLAIYLTLY
jgi:hypothetical protein